MITPLLVDRTPQALIYLLTQDGVISSPPVAADGFVVIPNAGGASPDLRTDASAAEASGAGGLPMLGVMNTLLGILANQALARRLLESGAGAIQSFLQPRCVMRITPRTGNITWHHDANIDGAGFAVVEIRSEVGVAATAYLHILYRHTEDF